MWQEMSTTENHDSKRFTILTEFKMVSTQARRSSLQRETGLPTKPDMLIVKKLYCNKIQRFN